MKIPLHKIDSFTNEVEDYSYDPWYEEKKYVMEVAGVDYNRLDFRYSSVHMETLIYIDNEFYGHAADIWDFFIG